jgi:hypothetical protein
VRQDVRVMDGCDAEMKIGRIKACFLYVALTSYELEQWQQEKVLSGHLGSFYSQVKKLCCSLRRNAKDERVLFHYNGHGVPKPTQQGEIWVFNRVTCGITHNIHH